MIPSSREEGKLTKNLAGNQIYTAASGPPSAPIKRPVAKAGPLSTARKIYFALTAVVVIVILVAGSILIVNESKANAAEHAADIATALHASSSAPRATTTTPYSATGTLPNLALPSPTGVFARFPELQELMQGNREFRGETEAKEPGLVEELSHGQHPKVGPVQRVP
jgi:hypothetical protein